MQDGTMFVQGVSQVQTRTQLLSLDCHIIMVVSQTDVCGEISRYPYLVLDICALLSARLSPSKNKRLDLDLIIPGVECKIFPEPETRNIDTGLDRMPRSQKQRIVALCADRYVISQ